MFTKIALCISIFSLICSIAGGSVRHTKKILNISLNDINKLINLRIIVSIFLLIILVIIGYFFMFSQDALITPSQREAAKKIIGDINI